MLVNNRTNKNMNFNYVIITNWKDRTSKYTCDNIEGYNKHLAKNADMCELIGGTYQQIKPVLDVDAYETDPKISEIIADINKVFPNKPVYYAKRDPREHKGKMKYSYRFYVYGVRIIAKNLKKLLIKNGFDKNPIYDMSIYDSNKVLFLPLTTQKTDGSKIPPLTPVDCEIFDCCASYIKEEFDDWDKVIESETPEPSFKSKVQEVIDRFTSNDEDIKDEDNENDNNKYLKVQKLIDLLSENRSSKFETWINVNWCIINICNKEKINEDKMKRLIHQFSKRSKSNYNEDKVDEWIKDNINRVRETGYGWNYLYQTCIKEDAPDFYEKLTQSYYNVKKEFETNHIKIIHPPFVVYIDENKDNIIQPIPLCEKSYRHIQAFVKEQSKKGEDVYKKKRFIEKWLDDPQIRKYNKMVFKPPPLSVAPQDYNTWTDFDILKTPYIPNDKIIERFLEYTNNLFNNADIVNYVLAYFANRLQNPANRNNVCIILYGEEGDGKNRFFDIFKNIVGKKYFTELESGKQLFNTHSCIEKEKLFICVNEARGKDNYENADILKSRITTETLMVNPKGIQEFEIENYCDYIMTTNNHNAVNIQDKSRRFLLVETSSYYSRNSDFFNSFSEDIVDNKKALRVIYEYLMKYDVKSVIPSGNFQSHIPLTEIQQTIIRDNRDKIELFLRDLVEKDEYITDNMFDEVKMKNSMLFAMWCNWIETNKIKNEYNSVSFGTRFGILIKKKKITEYIRKDTNSNTFINFGKLKNFFDNNP